jgi:uncharacterized protein YndB with AHSA1/START domain
MTELRIERTFNATAEAVFDAWTNPEVMRRWFHAGADWETAEAEVELRVGGRVRVVMRRPEGTTAEMGGEYLVIDRPNRLVMTWTFAYSPGNQQQLDVQFTQTGDVTTVVLLNTGISTDARRESQDYGWRQCLDELGRRAFG